MEIKLIFAVLAITMWSSFAGSPPPACIEIPADVDPILYVHESLEVVAALGLRRFVDVLFDRFENFVKCNVRSEKSKEGKSSCELKDLNIEAEFAELMMYLQATLSGIRNVKHETHAKVASLEKPLSKNFETGLNYFKEGFLVAMKGCSSKNLDKIEAIEKASYKVPRDYDAALHDAYKMGVKYPPNVEAAIDRFESKSNARLLALYRSIFGAIRAVAVSVTSPDVDVLPKIAEFRRQSCGYLHAVAKDEFRLMKCMYLKNQTKGEEAKGHSPVATTPKLAEICNRVNDMHDDFTGAHYANGKQSLNVSARIQAAEDIAACRVYEGTSMIFTVIKKQRARFANESQSQTGQGGHFAKMAAKKIYTAYSIAIDSYLNVTRIAQPESSSLVEKFRDPMHENMRTMVEDIVAGIEWISNNNDSTGIGKGVERVEEEAILVVRNLVELVYNPIMNGRNSSSETGVEISRVMEKTLASGIGLIKGSFDAIKYVLAEIFPDLYFEDVDCLDSFESIENKTLAESDRAVKSVFGAINMVHNPVSKTP